MRLFIALNLPAEEREAIRAATAPLRAAGLPVRWADAESLHLTLKFVGWVEPAQVDIVAETMARAATGTRPFELRIGGPGAFPTLRRPRVLWLGVEASPPLRCLKHDLEWELGRLGFEREVRAFQPHITLGRAVRDSNAGDFRALEALFEAMDYRSKVPVREVHLMRSHLSPAGARYERIAAAPLG